MSGTRNVREKAKSLWIKGMKTVGNTAASIANNTKFKVDEMTLQTRRRELLNDIAAKAYSLWLKGEMFPEQLTTMLNELQELDDHLNDLRTEKYSYMNNRNAESDSEELSDDGLQQPQNDVRTGETGSQTEKEAECPGEIKDNQPDDGALKDVTSSVRSEINGYFDHSASVGKMAEKMNTSLDQLSESMRQFSPERAADDAPASSQEGAE